MFRDLSRSLALLSGGDLTAVQYLQPTSRTFPPLMRLVGPREDGLTRSLADVETEHIRAVFASVDGNKTRAAEILGIDRKTLREKLRR